MRRPARSRAARAAAWVAALSLGGSIAAAPAAGAPAQAATGSGTVAATAQLSAHRRPVEHAYVAPHGTKINVMGEWAHPDDDTDIIGPCGVWHQRYGTRCGVIQITRGEGGGNATGPEVGPALGLRRENEDRVAHYRSGTVDIYYVDRVDFFYNQSAPLTNHIWDHTETLRRVTRIIRTTQPDVYVGWTPTQAAGHGNHQVAGRLIWEGMKAAADPHMFPGQLRGSHALSTWQVKKVFSGGSTEGTGGTTSSANCLTGFAPASPTGGTVAGVWTGYDSPYAWPKGNVQDRPAGTPKLWQQVADEGASAYPTQSRVMYQGTSRPACPMFAQTDASVPFQPNTRPDGSANPRAGEDDAILFGAARQDPGGLPLGTLEHLSLSRFYVVPGAPFTATLQLRAPGRAVPAGTVRLMLPGVDRRRSPASRSALAAPGREGDLHGDTRSERDDRAAGEGRRHLEARAPLGLHGVGGAGGAGRGGSLPPLGLVGGVRPVARADRLRPRAGWVAPTPCSPSASAGRSRCRSTCTTGRPHPGAARSR